MSSNHACRLSLLLSCVTAAAPALAQKSDSLETQYGDIRITKARRIQGKGDFSGVRLMGPQTLVTVPYPRSHSVLVLHADDIATKSEGTDQFAHATLTGNVRYTMTQNVRDGVTRVVTGTAERAVFDHKAERIEMDGSVRVNLNDPERLALPGTVRAGRVVVAMDKSPYLYTLTGPAAGNDISFTPKEDAPKKEEAPKADEKPKTRSGIGAVHVSGYDRGAFQVGQTAHFEGAGTTVDLSGKDQLSHAEIRAESFDADFTAARSALKTATAEGNARFHIMRPAAKKDAKQDDDLTGRSDAIEYDAPAAKFTLAGNVDADALAPGTLNGPAKIKVDRLIAHIAKPYSYEMKSAARNGLIRFAPVSRVPPPANPGEKIEPKKPALALGVVTISRFDYGLYAPGNSLRLTTAQGKILLESDDAATQTDARFLARDVMADIAPDNHVTLAKAKGDVEFRVKQTIQKTQDGKSAAIAQIVEGTAPELDYAGGAETRSLTMPGPFRATVADPSHLVQPGKLTGASGDKLIVTLTGDTYDYAIDSVNETAQIEFIPLPPVKKPDAKPIPGKNPAGKIKKISGR